MKKIDKTKIIRDYIKTDIGQIHVRISGSIEMQKRPLLCFHLSPVSGIIFESWLKELGKDRLTIAPDTPGYGMSDGFNKQPTISDYAKSMNKLLCEMGIQDADIMGYHTGSRICVELARQQTEKIRNLILISAPIYNEKEIENYKAQYGEPTNVVEDGSHLIELWQGIWKWRGPQQTAEDLMKIFPDHIQGGNKKQWGHMAAQNYSYEENISQITKPILVLNTNDDLFKYTKRIRPYLKNGKVLELENWGHGFLDYQTLETAQIIRNFLDIGAWPENAK